MSTNEHFSRDLDQYLKGERLAGQIAALRASPQYLAYCAGRARQRRRNLLVILCALLLACLLAWAIWPRPAGAADPAPAVSYALRQPAKVLVLSVHDGDTLTVRGPAGTIKVRLDGIDAPELKQPHGPEAREALAGLVLGRQVSVTPTSRDRYGRTVARLKAGRISVNAALVRQGHAWWYRQYAPKDKALARAEAEARAHHRGLWAQDDPTPPWEFRRAQKEAN